MHNLNINLPIEEDYGAFYQEFNINKLLCDISAVWVSKENPYIFNSQNEDSSNVNVSHESSINKANITSHNFSTSASILEEEFFQKNLETSTQNDGKFSRTHQIDVQAEIHQNINCEPKDLLFQKPNVISDISIAGSSKDGHNAKFGQQVVECGIPDKCSKNMYTNNIDNISVLNQILEEPDIHNNGHTEPKSANYNKLKDQLSTLSDIKNNFNLSASQIVSGHMPQKEAENCSINTLHERDDFSILEELGISPEKEPEVKKLTDFNNPHKSLQTNFNLNDKPASVTDIFPAKRLTTDDLKKFRFSKSKFQTDPSTHDNNHKFIKSQNKNDSQLDGSLKILSSSKQKFSGFFRIMDEVQEMDTDKNKHNNQDDDAVKDFHKHNVKLLNPVLKNQYSIVSEASQNLSCENINVHKSSVSKEAQQFETQNHASKCISKEPSAAGPSVSTMKKPLPANLRNFCFVKKAKLSKICNNGSNEGGNNNLNSSTKE